MSTVIQRSFAGGEIAPALYARVDVAKYQTGLRTCRNFFVMRHGGATNRPGTRFVSQVKDSSKKVRLIQFIFNIDQTFILEFGEYYVRFIKNGVPVLETRAVMGSVSNANPAVANTGGGAHGYNDGDEILFTDVEGMDEINNKKFIVSNSTITTFELKDLNGQDVDSTSYGVYTDGYTSRVYTLETNYIESDLDDLQIIQSADVVTVVHPNYPPTELSRLADNNWQFNEISFDPDIVAPTGVSVSGGTAGSDVYSYVVTAIAEETLEESVPSTAATETSGVEPSPTNPFDVTWSAVSGAQEYNVYRALNGVYGLIGVAGGLSFEDVGVDPDTTNTPPIERNPFDAAATTITNISQANPALLTYAGDDNFANDDVVFVYDVEGMTEVNNKKYVVTLVNTAANNFRLKDPDTNLIVDSTSFNAYTSGGKLHKAGAYPSTVTYYQQRLTFANTENNPEKVFASRSGQFKNFTISSPLQDDDAVTFTMAGRQVNEIRHIVDLRSLVIFTTSGEWTVGGDDAGILRPTSINPKQQSYYGSNTMPPIVIGSTALFVQARGSIIRDLGFDFQSDGYRGNDLTIFSAHLFDDYTLVDWSYQQTPHSVLWVVRSDGVLLSLTYVREQQLLAWARHDFDGGTVENVCVIPEGNEDVVYVTVKRTVDGFVKRYIERMDTRNIIDVVDTRFLDSSITYDGRNTGTTTMTLTGSVSWEYTEELSIVASADSFVSSDVGNGVHLTGSDGTIIRATITQFTSATTVAATPNKTVPVSMRNVAITNWSKAIKVMGGLDHLEGKDVSVFADGFVVASPYNESYDTITVSNGEVTLDKPYGVIHVGLPYISDIETLDIDTAQSETLADKYKNTQNVSVFVEESRGIFAGAKPPSDDSVDPLEDLVEYKLRNNENYDSPVELKTETVDVNIKSEWNSNGRVFIRQVDPIPLSVLAIAPAGIYPFRG